MLQAHLFAGAAQFAAQGRFFLLQSSNAYILGDPGAVDVYADGRNIGRFYQGDAIELDAPATRWEVVPVHPSLTGSVVIGAGSIRSARVSGTVNVVDDAAAKTAVAMQFFGGPSRTAGAGFYVFHGLRAVSRTVAVRSVRARPSGACSLYLYSTTGVPAPAGSGLVSSFPANRKLGASGATASVDHGAFSAFPPPGPELTITATFEAPSASAGEWHRIEPETPFLIEAGRALCIVANAPTLAMQSQWDFEEIGP